MFGLINKVTGCKGVSSVFQKNFQVQIPLTYNMQVYIYTCHIILLLSEIGIIVKTLSLIIIYI